MSVFKSFNIFLSCMATVYDVKAQPLIEKIADRLEEEIEMPEWAAYTKTGVNNEKPPQQENWYYLRAAAILRQIYTDGPVGVSRLRTRYGDRRNNGHAPEHHAKASGKVIRTILQDLEEQGYVETEEGEGRKITEEGQSLLDKESAKILQ